VVVIILSGRVTAVGLAINMEQFINVS
jgi:hypothetical protein